MRQVTNDPTPMMSRSQQPKSQLHDNKTRFSKVIVPNVRHCADIVNFAVIIEVVCVLKRVQSSRTLRIS